MTGKQKIDSVARQMSDCKSGKSDSIVCPYCRGENKPENKYVCCETFGKAVMAIIHREGSKRVIEAAEMAARN